MKKTIRTTLFLCFILILGFSSQVSAEPGEPERDSYQVRLVKAPNGETLQEMIINGPPEPPEGYLRPIVTLNDPHQYDNLSIVTSVPAFNWSFGCSATSAAMIAGYYDRTGYPNMYAGPTHGGVMPMDNSYWPDWTDDCGATRHQCPLSATHNGLDGRSTRGHVDDYWVCYGSTADDPFYGNWTEHTYGDCTGDFMYTNQTSNYGVSDGATRFYSYSSNSKLYCSTLESAGGDYLIDGTLGFKNFLESRGYTVTDCFYQKTDNQYAGGFSFADYKAEIDAGHPVMLHVEGHTMVGFGYDESSSNLVYLHDTWDYQSHTMEWGASYSGMAMVGVSIVHLAPPENTTAQTGNWHTGSTWTSGAVPGSSDDVTIQSGHTVTLDSSAQVQNLALEYGATLIIPEGNTLHVEDTFSNNGTLQQTKNVPAGSTTEFLHLTNAAGTDDKYHGLDITPASTGLGSTTVTIKGNHTGGCTTVFEDPLLYRCFDITPTNQETAALKFWYDEDERNEQTANDLRVWHNEGGSNWSQVGTYSYSETTTDCQTGDGQACWVEAAGISSYSVFDLGDGGSGPTAVTLTSLSGHSIPSGWLAAAGFVLSAGLIGLLWYFKAQFSGSGRFS
jgi:hypothetical protein